MASVNPRKDKAGRVVSYQVKWRLGGARTAPWQTERFDDEDSAKVFRDAVDENGQQWPPGWVKGEGYITAAASAEAQYVFASYAREAIKNRTGIEERYRRDCVRDLETYILPTFANCDVRSTEHFSSQTVRAWVNAMATTELWRGSKRKAMSPKTLRNLHGLLSSILNEAVKSEPPLRARNPCELTRLPRVDDDGVDDDEGEDMEFLTPEEVAGIVRCFTKDSDKRLVRVAYGTGMRWGEITALASRHAINEGTGRYKLRISRAWKRHPERGHYLGKPKSKRSRRTIEISTNVWGELVVQGIGEMQSNDLIFHNDQNERLRYSTFYDRWTTAVKRAKKEGLVPDFKHPTFHDLRHSHVAALLSDGHGLTYVQRRLGHESITTTSDRYGHLLPHAHDAAMETIDRALGYGDDDAELREDVPVRDPGRTLYVAHVGTRRMGFWDPEHAEELVEQWREARGDSVRVEKWSADWWERAEGNGLRDVRRRPVDRVRVWFVGPAVYAADGTELHAGAGVHEPQGRWVWEWEDDYTDEPAHARAEWRSGPAAETEACAWGLEEAAVRVAYAEARSDALRICSLNPAREAGSNRGASI